MEYKSNVSIVVSNIEGRLKKASDVDKLNRTIATYLQASNVKRIHNLGLAVNGSKIGNYSIKPLYVNPKNSPKTFAPKGKTGRVKFKNGKLHKTAYFLGWRGFRQGIQREAGFVNLQLSGKLKLSWVIEYQNKKVVIGFNSLYGTEVATGNEQRFGKQIWGISPKDYEQIEVIKKEFIQTALAKT